MLSQDTWPSHATDLVKSLVMTFHVENIRIWGQEIGKSCVTFQLKNRLLQENEDKVNLTSIVTFDMDNKGTWTHKFDSPILSFEIVESLKKAAILIQQGEEETIVLRDLLGGNFSKSLEVGKGNLFEVQIQNFIKD